MLKGASAEVLQSAQMDGNLFKPEQMTRFEKDPEYYRAFIKATEEQVNARFRTVRAVTFHIFPVLIRIHRWSTATGLRTNCRST